MLLLTDRLGIGGAEIVIRDLACNLDRDRFNVSVCCLRELGPTGTALAERGIDISALSNAAPRTDYLTSARLWWVLRAKRIDLIHSHTTHSLVDAATCRRLSPRMRAVHTFHFGNYPHHPPRTRLMEAVCSRMVDRLVAVGHDQRARIRQTYRMPDSKITVVHNGVDAPVSADGARDFRRSIGAEHKLLVGTIAHMSPQKGLHDLLAVARRVRDIRDDVHFVVVGGGDLRADLEQHRRQLGLDGVVTFAGLVIDAAARALPCFDIYFHPSLWEAMSISVLEAMAAGKPVVATDVGESGHLIEQRTDGVLCKPGDLESMTAAVLWLAQTPHARRMLGDAAARKVRQRLTVAHMARSYEDLYFDVLQGHARAHATR